MVRGSLDKGQPAREQENITQSVGREELIERERTVAPGEMGQQQVWEFECKTLTTTN